MPGGSENDLLISGATRRYNGNNSVRLSSITEHNGEHADNGQKKLSTFFGVVVPCCLSMFSVILFLRMGFIVGQAGLLEGLAMLLLAYAIIGLTVLSICAISTNGAIEGGGAYFMISRALGPEFGGAIGLMFFLANVASSTLYIFGIVEAIVSYFGGSGQLAKGVFPDGYWWNYLYGSAILLICLVVCLVGAEIYAKTTFLIFLIVMVSIASIIISFFAKKPLQVLLPVLNSTTAVSSVCNVSVVNYTGLSYDTMHGNLFEKFNVDYTTGAKQNFVTVFAVLFNGCTGIMAGANMSGDLKNPSRSIPVGTIAACVVTFLVYTILVILISATSPRALLQCSYSFLLSINLWSPLVAIGVFASSLSAALSCLIGASRILLALARDELFGILLRPVTKTTHSGNPIVAVLVSWFLVQMTLFAGKVNTIAPIVTIFFLFSYAATDLACLALEWASAPNFRPTFKYFTWHTCLLGFISCITMMFLINAIYTSISVLVLVILLIIIHYRVPSSSWGYISQALIFHQVRKYMLMLDVRKEHVKFWRPQILLMVKNPRSCCQLIDFINSIKKSGLYVLGHVSIGHLADMDTDILNYEYKHWLNLVDELNVKAFVELTLSGSVREGTEHLLRISGLGGMKPNTLVLGFYDDSSCQDTFLKVGAFGEKKRRSGSRLSAIIADERRTEDETFESRSFFESGTSAFDLSDDASEQGHGLPVEEYVAIIYDALKLRKNVCLARYFDQLDKTAVMQDKNRVHYIDVWPINFLKPLLTNNRRGGGGTSLYPPLVDEATTESTSYFDTTSVFLMQMACILNMTPFWKKKTKLRIFLCVEPGDDSYVTPGDQELEEFLQTVRINAEIKQVTWSDPTTHPDDNLNSGDPTIQTPSKHVMQQDNGENLHAAHPMTKIVNDQPKYLKRVNTLIRSQHEATAVTFLYLPAPPRDATKYKEYNGMLTAVSDQLGPTLFVHGLSHVISTTL
uniref:Solute carrier family 12 member 9 n=1 Tax=Phallusia mammillata TaxID=59560 RepID=A0A6F9DTA7_9ASCI|nr:solute carrier family 12 member 9-like [Phallusia mammillata]